MIKKIAVAAIIWIAALYSAQASTLLFNGVPGSGGPPMGHAENITCARNWWAFGLVWSCNATIVANDGQRHPYSDNSSALTPAAIGTQVPMTLRDVRSSRSSQATPTWAPAERKDPSKGLSVLGLMGFPAVALFITFRLFRTKNP